MILIINPSTKFSTPQTVLALVAKRLDVWFRTSVCLEENVRSFDVKRTDVFSPSNRGTKKEGRPWWASLLQVMVGWLDYFLKYLLYRPSKPLP